MAMTVAQVIDALKQFDPENTVRIMVDEDDYHPDAIILVSNLRTYHNGQIAVDTEFEYVY